MEFPQAYGLGIFRAEGDDFAIIFNAICYADLSSRHQEMPTMWQDLRPITNKNNPVWELDEYFCAFPSLKDMQNFVLYEELIELIQLGFRVLHIEASEYIVGEYQYGYRKEDVTLEEDVTFKIPAYLFCKNSASKMEIEAVL
jgi:hypothetical protein